MIDVDGAFMEHEIDRLGADEAVPRLPVVEFLEEVGALRGGQSVEEEGGHGTFKRVAAKDAGGGFRRSWPNICRICRSSANRHPGTQASR